MPWYSFKCDECDSSETKKMSIPEYLKSKDKKEPCKKCGKGSLSREIRTVSSEIDRSSEELTMQAQEEIKKTVQKIRAGDEKATRDIYGDRLNPLK